MAELLLELLSEEIPARMQPGAAQELRRLVETKLEEAGLAFETVSSAVTPRRLALMVTGLAPMTRATSEERRGPRQGAPPAAIDGFLKSAGFTDLGQCELRDTGKGVFYFAHIDRPGRAARDILPALLRAAILELAWPKSMRFPAARFRWVRPLTSVVSLFEGEVLPLELDAVPVGDRTLGHRFLSPEPITVTSIDDYRTKLKAAHVVLEAAERRRLIEEGLNQAAAAKGLKVKPDPDLLAEVAGLVEWPVVLMGRIEQDFMMLPPELLATVMRAHQKYFACLDAQGKLAPYFLVCANMAASDGGKAIIAGNERVLRARLSDARFFWEQDLKITQGARLAKLEGRVFHAKLGTMREKAGRLMRLAVHLAPSTPGSDGQSAARAAQLAKSDLSSHMVGEFPELQGIMGRYYAEAAGEPPEVAAAIAAHYAPKGPDDPCPHDPTSVVVALADKIDTLAGFFSIGEEPTGSKDPFALRRAALGVIRLILENGLRLPLLDIFRFAYQGFTGGHDPSGPLLAFFSDRLKVHLREEGVRHDLIAAIMAPGSEDDLVRLRARVDALTGFLADENGTNLLTAY
ncbi:MAG TPA: glycine--tRNA ligase subunit beta, partial [Stellaceae bacterium]|nr:glycine--tRNA ligase subunit beta [Stellaceae bacterium]